MGPGRHVIAAAVACALLAPGGIARAAQPDLDGSPGAAAGAATTAASAGPAGDLQPPQAPPPPKPGEAGIHELVRKTIADFGAFPKRESTWVILGVGGATAAVIHPIDHDLNGHLAGTAAGRFFAPGKVIGSAPVQIGTSVGLYVIGRYLLPHAQGAPKTNKVSHLGFDLLRAQIVSQAFVAGIKVIVRRDRPTGECCSFPSGHAAASFAAASVLERHLGYRAAWPTMVIASYVGASRLHDNRHFLSDVVFGLALGIATGWTVVGRHGRSDYTVLPVPVRGGVALMVSRATRACQECGAPVGP